MEKLPYPVDKEGHAHMRMRQNQNRVSCLKSKAETWAYDKLKEIPIKWTRQAQWGYRLYDFWNGHYGVAVEIDGKEHKKEKDALKDEYNFRRSGIVVLRVPNHNEEVMSLCLETIRKIIAKESWAERRERLGCTEKKPPLVKEPDEKSCLKEYLDSL